MTNGTGQCPVKVQVVPTAHVAVPTPDMDLRNRDDEDDRDGEWMQCRNFGPISTRGRGPKCTIQWESPYNNERQQDVLFIRNCAMIATYFS